MEQESNILDNVLASVQAGIVVIDCQSRITRINPFAESLFDVSSIKAIGEPLSSVISGSTLPEVLETGQMAGPVSQQYNGKHVLAKHHPLFSQSGKLSGALSVYTDITKNGLVKRQLMEALQKERELEALLDHSHDGIWIMDGKGTTLRVSKSWEDFSGIKREEVIGRMVHDIVAEGIYTDSAAIHVIEKGEPVTIIYRTRTQKLALVTASPVFGADGKIWRIISNVRDITEMDRYRKELEKSQASGRRFRDELKLLRQQESESSGIIARSQAMKEVLETATQTAGSEATILISGETGVGKDVVARFIHSISGCNDTFIRVNCGAIPETLMESELFGYEEGSFTGARQKGKPGLFELAQGGTLFLDEIGELPIAMQAKLLHALQDRTIMRVGGVLPISLHVRVIAATNRDLKAMAEDGRFRQDLYYRLNVIPLHIPPLRNRPDDIIPLAMHFLEKHNKKHKTKKSIVPAALELLRKYGWPGNIRELENTIERLVLVSQEDIIDVRDLPAFIKGEDVPSLKGLCFSLNGSLKDAREELDKSMLSWALKRYGSTRKAAAALGVTQPTVVRLAHKFGLEKADL
jgi:PAS domain S-box-containing protein